MAAEAHRTDIAIVGGGLAGSTAALLMAQAGMSVAVIDPYPVYPDDFRCEKLTASQVRLVRELGLEDVLAPVWTPVHEVSIAREGRLVEQKAADERCLRYDAMVNAVRDAWPASVEFVEGRVDAVETTSDRQTIRLNGGSVIDTRLVVLATGPGDKLRSSLGMRRRVIRARHSVSVGLDLVNDAGGRVSDSTLTYYGERAGDGIAFATFFPLGGRTRCNLFCYLDPKGPGIRQFREAPQEALHAFLPSLKSIAGNVNVAGEAEIRVCDLYEIDGVERDGVVLIGDARRSSCPATGTGVSRVLCDAERLVKAHLPRWLATPGMAASKIAGFYADPFPLRLDRDASARAERYRYAAVSSSWRWRIRRLLVLGQAHLRRTLQQGRPMFAKKNAAADARRAAGPRA